MPSWVRLAAVAAALAAVGAGFALTNRTPAPRQTTPAPTSLPTGAGCLPVPARGAPTPSWYPRDLPLPQGAYVAEALAPSGSTERVIFVVPGDLAAFVRHALQVWPKHGWVLGRGESEPGEAEDQFAKPKEGRYGAFRARSIYCDRQRTWVLIVLSARRVSASPSGTASP